MRRSYPAYRRAYYRANAGGTAVEIRVGKRTPALDALLGRLGKRRWAFLTGENPGARRLSADENADRTKRLKAALRARGALVFPGVSGSDRGDWPEESSVLVVGIGLGEADRLRRRFGQDAFVTGVRESRARLWP